MFTRLTTALFAVLALIALAQPATAQSRSDAEALNSEGKKLFKEQRYLEAYKRFKQAAAISPEGKFFFNLCFSLNYLERFQEAIDACEQVEPSGADAKLIQKTNAVLEALRAKIPAQPDPIPPDPNNPDPNNPDPNNPDPNNPDPNNPDPNNPDPNNITPPGPNAATGSGPAKVPGLDPFAVKKAPNGYQWSLGGTVAPLANLGVGQGETVDRFYEGGGARLTLFANFMYKQAQKLGLQGYFGLSTLPPRQEATSDALTVLDFGGAGYKHFKLARNIDLTPLVGLHVALMQPEPAEEEALIALGLRAQVSIDWSFGSSKEHVLSFSPTLNAYSAASDSTTLTASTFGLDRGGATFEIAIGYQYRFTQPFGSGPLFTLE